MFGVFFTRFRVHMSKSYVTNELLKRPDSRFPELWPDGYLKLARSLGENSPLLRAGTSCESEYEEDPERFEDPTGEADLEVSPYLLRKYRDKVLFLTTADCFFNCRFCFRRGWLGRGCLGEERYGPGVAEVASGVAWVENNPDISEVILSGGDPLTLGDGQLAVLLNDFGGIEHLRSLRIHSRAPVVKPDRVTASLLQIFNSTQKPLTLVIHVTHPDELTTEVRRGLEELRRGGVGLENQSVLLKGVNDDPRILATLITTLNALGVTTRYLHHPDRAWGNKRFRVSIRRGGSILRELKMIGVTALPPYVLDLPNGGGKCAVESLTAIAGQRSDKGARTLYRWVRPDDWKALGDATDFIWWDIWEPGEPVISSQGPGAARK